MIGSKIITAAGGLTAFNAALSTTALESDGEELLIWIPAGVDTVVSTLTTSASTGSITSNDTNKVFDAKQNIDLTQAVVSEYTESEKTELESIIDAKLNSIEVNEESRPMTLVRKL